MERYNIEFGGKSYVAVAIDGKCVDLDTCVIASNDLNDALTESMENHDANVKMAYKIDEGIFGFAEDSLIANGTEEELKEYVHGLL